MHEYTIIVASIAMFLFFGCGAREKAADSTATLSDTGSEAADSTASFSDTYGSEAAAAIEGNDSVKDLTTEGL